MFSLKSDEMTDLSLFIRYSYIVCQTEQLLQKKFLDLMFSLESDKMTSLWPNDSLTFTFYVTFSNFIPNGRTFVKEVFWFDDQFIKGWNDCFVTQWQLNFNFLTYWAILVKEVFLIWCLVYKATKWLPCDQMTA